MNNTSSESNYPPIPSRLWAIGAKLKGLGYLIGHQTPDSVPTGDEMGYGIGEILRDLGSEIDEILEQMNPKNP